MKLTRPTQPQEVKLADLQPGDTFETNKCLYIVYGWKNGMKESGLLLVIQVEPDGFCPTSFSLVTTDTNLVKIVEVTDINYVLKLGD